MSNEHAEPDPRAATTPVDTAVGTAEEPGPAEEPAKRGAHEAPDGAPLHPLIDLSRDPNPGHPDHARTDEEA